MAREDAQPVGADAGGVVVTKDNLKSDKIQAVLEPDCA